MHKNVFQKANRQKIIKMQKIANNRQKKKNSAAVKKTLKRTASTESTLLHLFSS